MATANILVVCDAIAAAIEAGLDDPGDAEVERVYLAPTDLKDTPTRRVWVFPSKYQNSAETRAEDLWVYTVSIIVAERYDEAGEPSAAWVDERVDWVQEKLNDGLNYARDHLAFGTGSLRRLWTQTTDALVYDPDRLSSQKTFWSELTFEFREIQDA